MVVENSRTFKIKFIGPDNESEFVINTGGKTTFGSRNRRDLNVELRGIFSDDTRIFFQNSLSIRVGYICSFLYLLARG